MSMSYKDAVLHPNVPGRTTFEEALIHHLNEPPGHLIQHEHGSQAKEAISLLGSCPPTAWMGRCASAISKRPLNQVILPGAHDCGTYSLSKNSLYASNLQKVSALKALSFIGLDKVTKGIVASWAVCQSANTQQQLEDGIRYFDLRVAALNNEFYIWHGLCGEPIINVFTVMARYAAEHPTEILLLDLVPHHFNDFTDEHHLRFSDAIIQLFGKSLAPSSQLSVSSKVEDFWNLRVNVIVIYNPPEKASSEMKKAVFWKPDTLHSHWPNHCKNPEQWLAWAEHHSASRPVNSPFFVLQGVITPDAGIITKFNGVGSVFDLSKRINPKVVEFLIETPHRNHNIIMLDFYNISSLIIACHWVNVGGNFIFPDKLGFGGAGHSTFFQKTTFRRPNGRLGSIAIAQSTAGSWHTALFDPDDLCTWQASVPLNSLSVSDPKYHAMTRLFSIGDNAYVAACTPWGMKIYAWIPVTRRWNLDSACDVFDSNSGFGIHSPIYRSTFSVVSSKNNEGNAYFVALTTGGLTVVQYSAGARPIAYIWSGTSEPSSIIGGINQHKSNSIAHSSGISESMSKSVIQDYNPSASSHIQKPDSLVASTQIKHEPRNLSAQTSSVSSHSHGLPLLMVPFIFGECLYILFQGPINLLQSPQSVGQPSNSQYEVGLLKFVEGSFEKLNIEGLPPLLKVSAGVRSSSAYQAPTISTPDDKSFIYGSPWMVECAGSSVYFVCRSSTEIRTWRFTGEICFELPSFTAFSDEFHWNLPQYSKSLRLFTLHNQLYMIGRSSEGIVMLSLFDDEQWVPVEGIAEFTDSYGWNQEESSKSIHVVDYGDQVYLTGRHPWGLLSVSYSKEGWKYCQRPSLQPNTFASPSSSIS